MAALVTTIYAGRYTGVFNSQDLGVLEDPGWRLGFTPDHQLVNNTDAYGSQVIETIWRGFSSVTLDFRSIEWKLGTVGNTATVGASNQFSFYASTGATGFRPGLVGRRGTDLAKAVVLTAVTGTPAATASSPASVSFYFALLREGFNVEWTFGTQNRVLPIGFRILPDSATTYGEYWAAT